VQCAAGMAMHDPSYIAGLRALCDRYGVHLIADEIAVGCGRTGTFFASAALDLFASDDVLAANAAKSAQLRTALEPLATHPRARNLRQCGTIFAFDAAVENSPLAKTFARRFFEHALQREVLLRPIGTTVYLMPPYVLDTAELEWLAARTLEIFDATVAEGR
jgi:adenosylmethionine-8-amino-7-oxononanoate aminotransferase